MPDVQLGRGGENREEHIADIRQALRDRLFAEEEKFSNEDELCPAAIRDDLDVLLLRWHLRRDFRPYAKDGVRVPTHRAGIDPLTIGRLARCKPIELPRACTLLVALGSCYTREVSRLVSLRYPGVDLLRVENLFQVSVSIALGRMLRDVPPSLADVFDWPKLNWWTARSLVHQARGDLTRALRIGSAFLVDLFMDLWVPTVRVAGTLLSVPQADLQNIHGCHNVIPRPTIAAVVANVCRFAGQLKPRPVFVVLPQPLLWRIRGRTARRWVGGCFERLSEALMLSSKPSNLHLIRGLPDSQGSLSIPDWYHFSEEHYGAMAERLVHLLPEPRVSADPHTVERSGHLPANRR